MLLYDGDVYDAIVVTSLYINFALAYHFRRTVLHHLLTVFLRIVTLTYFKSIDVVGRENIPKGPTPIIFVANHSNQFVDGLLLATTNTRQISFLIAAKSMKRAIVGQFASILGAIPVSRPQDNAVSCAGTLSVVNGEYRVVGVGTRFTELEEKATLLLPDGVEVVIACLISDIVLTIEKAWEHGTLRNAKFQMLPRVDQREVYREVHMALGSGRCLAIFPEGGSHDQTHLLPLKAGVALMGLGAMATNDKMARVCIIPCGLNYFRGHRFRSRCVVEYGAPLWLSNELVDLFKTEKRTAVAQLLTEIEKRMRAVIPNAPDYNTLATIIMARTLWTPAHVRLSVQQVNELNNRFLLGYDQVKEDPEVRQMMEHISQYRRLLKKHGLQRATQSLPSGLSLAAELVLGLIIGVLALLPAVILNAPVGLVARIMAWREAKRAVANSRVKIKGRDVVSSYKILVSLVLVPSWYATWSVLLIAFSGWSKQYIVLAILSMPLFSYLGVVFIEQEMLVAKRLKPLILRVLPSYRAEQKLMAQMENELTDKVRDFVRKFAPHLALEEARTKGGSAAIDMKSSGSWGDLLTLHEMFAQGEIVPAGLLKKSASLHDLANALQRKSPRGQAVDT